MDVPKILEPKIKFVQDCFASFPVIILGSGYSAQFGVPDMSQLADHLRNKLPSEIQDDDKANWITLEESLKNNSLEIALQQIQIRPTLLDLIMRETWNLIYPADTEILQKIIHRSVQIPLAQLLTHLFRSTHARISLVTTNYDRLAEYSVDYAGFNWTTGFDYGYIGEGYSNKKYSILRNGVTTRIVDIWKVHGSLDWFRGKDEQIYFLPSIVSPPKDFQPVIVTPGIEKYRITHEEPFRSMIAGADSAIESGNSFLCIGYGFNDEHIQPKLLERCRHQEKNIVVITKKLTESAKKVLFDGGCPCFLAFEESTNGTRMFSDENATGIELEGIKLWMLDSLLNLVL